MLVDRPEQHLKNKRNKENRKNEKKKSIVQCTRLQKLSPYSSKWNRDSSHYQRPVRYCTVLPGQTNALVIAEKAQPRWREFADQRITEDEDEQHEEESRRVGNDTNYAPPLQPGHVVIDSRRAECRIA